VLPVGFTTVPAPVIVNLSGVDNGLEKSVNFTSGSLNKILKGTKFVASA